MKWAWIETRGAATHGEYKTPQGKLVAVDLPVSEDRLAGVRITGDFFLEPPEALPELNRALVRLRDR